MKEEEREEERTENRRGTATDRGRKRGTVSENGEKGRDRR